MVSCGAFLYQFSDASCKYCRFCTPAHIQSLVIATRFLLRLSDTTTLSFAPRASSRRQYFSSVAFLYSVCVRHKFPCVLSRQYRSFYLSLSSKTTWLGVRKDKWCVLGEMCVTCHSTLTCNPFWNAEGYLLCLDETRRDVSKRQCLTPWEWEWAGYGECEAEVGWDTAPVWLYLNLAQVVGWLYFYFTHRKTLSDYSDS